MEGRVSNSERAWNGGELGFHSDASHSTMPGCYGSRVCYFDGMVSLQVEEVASRQNVIPREWHTDNCCAERKRIQEVFAKQRKPVSIKLNKAHAVMRSVFLATGCVAMVMCTMQVEQAIAKV